MGKGSKRRPEDKELIDANWDRIFNKDTDPDSLDDDELRAFILQQSEGREEIENQANSRAAVSKVKVRRKYGNDVG